MTGAQLKRPLRSEDHVYAPRGSCRQAFLSRESEVLIAGPAGTGKSRACLEKIHFMAMLSPGSRYLICRKTRSSLASTGLVTWRKFVVAKALKSGDVNYYGGSTEESGYYYRNGSVVILGGLDKSSKIMSSEYDLIYVQEATELTEDDWEALLTRLRNGMVSFQQLLADANPQQPTHWLKQRCNSGRTVMIESRHKDNPRLFNPFTGDITEDGRKYLGKLNALTGVRRARLLDGKWVAAEGMIYDGFDPAVHLVDAMPEGWESWERYWSVDFGFTNPFVWQCWAEDPDGRLYLYREIYRTKRTVEAHATRIKQCVLDDKGRWKEPRPRKIVCDHDAEGRAQLEAHFGATTPAHKAVTEGIQACQERYKLRKDGRPGIYILRGCRIDRDEDLADRKKPTCTEEEIPGYVWLDHAIKDQPVKEDDHGMDAKRYIVADRDLGPNGNPLRGWIR